jgi:prolyl-tRNA synthetase
MKDAYSFDADQEGLSLSYEKMLRAYNNIFKDYELEFIVTEADPGAMGGSSSHEFMVPADIGEDQLYLCESCGKYFGKGDKCKYCGTKVKLKKMIEVGHVFKLGTKYSQAQEAFFLDQEGTRKPLIMGCYGIGVSRLIAAIIEQNHDKKGIIWPKRVSPFNVSLLVLEKDNDPLYKKALGLYDKLNKAGFQVLFDERPDPAGVKFNDAYLIGNPYIVILGKRFLESKKIELEIRRTAVKHNFSEEELIQFLKQEYASG